MPPIKLATSVWHTSLLPRDAAMINPVVNVQVPSGDYGGLVDDWVAALRGVYVGLAGTQIQVKAYDVTRAKPNYPVYEEIYDAGLVKPALGPRELALCLSFYAGNNIKRRRGRLYIPAIWGVTTGTPAERPSTTNMNNVAALVPALTELGGVDVDWSVWSGVDKVARAVTNWWVDNEWDVQRKRGLRGTTRVEGTTSEDTTRERQLA